MIQQILIFGESWNIYYETYYKPYADKINESISSLQINVLNKLFNSDDIEKLIEEFTFETKRSGNGEILFSVDSFDNFRSLSFSNKYGINSSGYGYIKLKDESNASRYLSDILFKKHEYNNLYQHFNSDLIKIPSAAALTSSLFDSRKDATMVFWTKIPSGEYYNDHGIFSIINEQTSEEIYFQDDEFGSITRTNNNFSIPFRNDDIKNNTDEWIMWSIKFDNHNQNKLGIQVTVYNYDELGNLNSHSLNNSIFTIKNPEENKDYFNKLSDEFFDNPNLKFGYNYKISANELTKNEEFFNGRIRNLIIFRGHLTSEEERSLFNKGIVGNYTWNYQYDEDKVKEIKTDADSIFFLGMIGVYDCPNVLIQNCLINFNGKTYNI